MPETRGLCLSEEQTISTVRTYKYSCFFLCPSHLLISFNYHELRKHQVLRRPRIGAGNRAMDMRTEPYKLTRRCEVTAILILYGLPRYCYTLSATDVVDMY